MNWSHIPKIASTAGTLIAAGSLVWGILIYHFSQRDTYVAELRKAIARCRANCKKAATLLQEYEMTSEIVSRVVYSKELEIFLVHIFDKFFHKNSESTERIESYLDIGRNVPTIWVPVQTPVYRHFEETIDQVGADIAHYQIDYPGLFRVLSYIATNIEILAKDIKAASQDEGNWKGIIISLKNDGMSFESVEEFKNVLAQAFIFNVMKELTQQVHNIDSLQEMLDLVSDSFLSKKEKELNKLKKKAKGMHLIPISKTRNLADDLEEAEKSLQFALKEDELRAYRTIVARLR